MNAGRVISIVATLLFAFALITWLRDSEWHIVKAFTLVGGHEPSFLYDIVGGGSMLLITIWGPKRLARRSNGSR